MGKSCRNGVHFIKSFHSPDSISSQGSWGVADWTSDGQVRKPWASSVSSLALQNGLGAVGAGRRGGECGVVLLEDQGGTSRGGG